MDSFQKKTYVPSEVESAFPLHVQSVAICFENKGFPRGLWACYPRVTGLLLMILRSTRSPYEFHIFSIKTRALLWRSSRIIPKNAHSLVPNLQSAMHLEDASRVTLTYPTMTPYLMPLQATKDLVLLFNKGGEAHGPKDWKMLINMKHSSGNLWILTARWRSFCSVFVSRVFQWVTIRVAQKCRLFMRGGLSYIFYKSQTGHYKQPQV